MFTTRLRSLSRIAVLGVLSSALGACAIATPFPRLAVDDSAPPDETELVLVLTRIVVDTGQRAEFDRQTRLVIDSMPSHPGLLGYSARRELFGNHGWTLSIWRDDAARERFVKSAVHQRAIEESRPAMIRVELKRLQVRRADLPQDWASALRMLDDPEGLRTYRN